MGILVEMGNGSSYKRFAFHAGDGVDGGNFYKPRYGLGMRWEENQAGLGLSLIAGMRAMMDSDGGGKGKQAEMSKSKEMATVAHSSPPAEPLDSTTVMEEATKEARRKQAKEWDVK